MDDIKINKKNNSKFIINDDNVLDDDFDFKQEQTEQPDVMMESDDEGDFDDDILKDRLYDEEEDEIQSQSSFGGMSVSSRDDSDESRRQKSFYLFKLKSLEKKGHTPTRMFTMDDKLSKIKGEVERINKEIEITRGVEFSRQGLMFFTNGLEMLNNKFDPLDLQLDGWSESMASNIDSYDDVFEELYEKYHTKVAVAPEVKLIMMVLGSAFMFHFSKSFAKNSANVANVLNNPDVMSAMGNAMAKEAAKEAKVPQKSQPQRKMKEPDTDIDDLLAQLETDSTGGEDVKNIPLDPPKKRGRPKKKVVEEEVPSMVFDI